MMTKNEIEAWLYVAKKRQKKARCIKSKRILKELVLILEEILQPKTKGEK